MMISVLLTDDHQVVRQGIKMVLDLDPELEVVGEASNDDVLLEVGSESHGRQTARILERYEEHLVKTRPAGVVYSRTHACLARSARSPYRAAASESPSSRAASATSWSERTR